jgi:D-alanine--poly(phosphoribitol) ligase subunit 2
MDDAPLPHDACIDWIAGWFAARAPIPPGFDLANGNYFEAGLIDSFAVIELIEAIETQFEIRFTEVHFQDRRFTTVGGLAEIIRSLTG